MRKLHYGIICTPLVVVVTIIGIYFYGCEKPKTTDYTNLTIQNSSMEDSVLVYVTLQNPNSVVGLFGIQAEDTIGSASKGTFYAYKDSSYSSNDSSALLGVVISFGGDAMPCKQAIAAGFRWGVNVFECSINTPYEVLDISTEDGVNSIIKVSVNDSLWTTGDGEHITQFDSTQNKFPVEDNLNIRGVFPWRCTICVAPGSAVPENCLNIKDTCNAHNICQAARTNNNGGNILVQFLGSPQILK